MSQLWTITNTSGTQVLSACFATPSAGSHPKDNGWNWNALTQKATPISLVPDLTTQVWNGTVWTDDLSKVKLGLITQVKATNEAFVRSIYSTNYGKQKKYSRKQQEVMDWRALSPLSNALTMSLASFLPAFVALGVAAQRKKFRFAMAEASLRGVGVDVVIAEYETAIDAVESKIANYEAIEQAAIKSINAATTASAARAAYAAINWQWKP